MNEVDEIFASLIAIMAKLDDLGYSVAALHVNNALEEIQPNDPRIPRVL
jgi:hypothetical protein